VKKQAFSFASSLYVRAVPDETEDSSEIAAQDNNVNLISSVEGQSLMFVRSCCKLAPCLDTDADD
jgi:hypothetical protein